MLLTSSFLALQNNPSCAQGISIGIQKGEGDVGRLLSRLLDSLLNLGPPALICNAEIFQKKQSSALP